MQATTNGDFIQPDLPSLCLYNKTNVANNPHPFLQRKKEQKIFPNILHCIGNTPLVKLNQIPQSMGIKCEVLVKCEFLNPGGSIKDRIAISMVEDAENRGLLKPGYTMIEPTSGNTGIAMGLVSAVKGYQSVCVFPEKSSSEKEDILKALGAQIVRTSDKIPYNQPGGIFAKPCEIQKETPNSIILHQFRNSMNPLTHYYTTSLEILEQCDEKIDMVAMGVGTGGSMTGIGRKFKEVLPKCLIVGVDPYGSTIAEPASLNKTDVTYFEIEGIGHNYTPTTLDKTVTDFWIKVNDEESLNMARRLHKEEGLLCGASAGTILYGALQAAKSLKEDQRCVVILPDGVGNYLTKFVSDYWMEVRNIIPLTNSLNHWWWNLKVSLLNPKINVSLSTACTCGEALKMMTDLGHDILPVIDEDNNLQGIVTSKKLMKHLLNSSVKANDSVEKIMHENYGAVTVNSTFGILSRILDNEGVAVVVEKKNESNRVTNELIGLVFPMDLLQYIAENRI